MFEIRQLSAAISALITRFAPPCARVTAFEAPNKLTMTSGPPTSPANFFPPSAQLNNDQKHRLFLHFTRSFGCQQVVLLYAIALKQLIDSGIPLSHNTHPVVDVWILNSGEFPVDDLQDSALVLRDARSRVSISSLGTHHNKQMLRAFGKDICASFGFGVPEKSDGPPEGSASFRDTVPHWWLAFLVDESLRTDESAPPKLKLVHVDLCGAAYFDDGFDMHNGEIVSQKMFESPPYIIRHTRLLSQSTYRRLPHKFLVTSLVRIPSGKEVKSLMPRSIRHLRCLDSDGSSVLEMTPLPTFVDMRAQEVADLRLWSQQVAELRDSLILEVPCGTAVRLCGLRNRTELNGRAGRIIETQDACRVRHYPERYSERRIRVQVTGLVNAVTLRSECVSIDQLQKQYRSLAELKRETDALVEEGRQLVKKMPALSKREMRECRRLMNGPEVTLVMECHKSGNAVISRYLDDTYVRGVRELLRPPLRKLFSDDIIETFTDGLSIAEDPKGREALRIIKMLGSAKKKMIEKHPETLQAGGAVAIETGGEFHRLLHSVARKIEEDERLSEIFTKIDERGSFPNPVKLAAKI